MIDIPVPMLPSGLDTPSLLIDLVEGTRSAPHLETVPGRIVPRASTAR